VLRAFVDLADKGAHGHAALEQQFGNMPAGLALPAAGSGRDENRFCHGFTSLMELVPCGTVAMKVWY
jgi:hypothetical protein